MKNVYKANTKNYFKLLDKVQDAYIPEGIQFTC